MAVAERRRRRAAIVAQVREHHIGRWIDAQLADVDEAREKSLLST
jgi:trehalose-6-phosphate synthase